jgi:hypothetical protein
VLLLFWDSTSRFSGKALWALNELYKAQHGDGLEVVGLNFDEDRDKGLAMVKDLQV